MHDPEFSQIAQHWANVVLIWIGFGSLAGLVARIILPVREPSSPLPTMALGIAGSALGLAILSWANGNHPLNPISWLGFMAATGGAVLLLAAHQVVVMFRRQPDEKDDVAEE